MTVLARRWLLATMMVVLGAGFLLALIHTPIARSWFLAYTVRSLDEDVGVRLEADRLDFNVLTLDFELAGLSIARSDLPDTPFLTAERARVDLPWSAVLRTMSFTTIEIDRPTISLIQSSDGTWNLPTNNGSERRSPDVQGSLPAVGQLQVVDLGIVVRGLSYTADAAGLSMEMTAAPNDSQRIAGPLRLTGPARFTTGERQTTLDALEARLAFQNETLEIESLDVQLPGGQFSLDGDVRSVARDPDLAVAFDGDIQLASAADWWPVAHEVAGEVDIDGTLTGPIREPRIAFHVEASDVRWADISSLDVRADVRVDSRGVSVDEARATDGIGTVEGSARLSMPGAVEPSRAEVTWRDVDTGTLLSQLNSELSPIPAGIVSGQAELAWTTWRPDAVELTAEMRSRQSTSGVGRVPLGGAATVELSSGRWRAELDELTLPGMTARGRVNGRVASGDTPLVNTTIAGAASADIADLARVVKTLGFSPGQDDPSIEMRGTAAIDLMIAGTLEKPVARGHIRSARVGLLGIDDIELETGFVADLHHVEFDTLTSRLGPNVVNGDLAFGFGDAGVEGHFDLTLPDIARFADALPDAIAPGGHIDGQVIFGGRLESPTLRAEFEGREIMVAGRAIDAFTTAITLDDDVVAVKAFEARRNASRVHVEGHYAVSSGAHEINATGQDVPLAALVSVEPEDAPLKGQLSFDVTSSGPPSDFKGNGRARIEGLEWQDRALGAADVVVSVVDGAARVSGTMPALNASATATVGLVEDTSFELAAELSRTDLETIALGSVPDMSGVVSLTLTAVGDRVSPADARIEAELRELDGEIGLTRVRLVEPGGIEYAAGQVRTERIELLVNDSRLTLAGGLGSSPTDRLAATLAGNLSDVETLVGWLAAPGEPPVMELSGPVNAEAVVTGSLREPNVSGRINLSDGTVAISNHPPAQSLDLDVSYDAQTITLNELDAYWQGAHLRGAGELPAALMADWVPAFLIGPPPDRPRGRLTVSVDEISTAVLAPFIDPETLAEVETHASARLELEADGLALEDVRAVLSFGRLDLTVSGIPLSQRRETRLELADGRLEVGAFALGNDDDYITIGGGLGIRGDATADLTVTAELDLRTASPFVPDGTAEGDAFLIANVLGPVDDPDVSGTLEVTNAGIRLREPQLIVSDMNGALFLTRDTIQFHELSGEANGGSLDVTGVLDLVGLRPEGDVLIVSRGIAMELPEGVRTELDTDLTLTLTTDEVALRGDVTVTRGEYREPLLLTGGLLAALQAQESVTVVGLDETSALDTVNVNVRIVTAEDIVIDNNYADASVSFDLRVLGTAASPALTGRAALAEGGRIRLGNRVYEIDSGSVDFVDPTGIEPDLNITARTRVSGRDITLTLSGVPDALSTSLQSDGGESESDIVSLLLTGRTVEEVGLAPELAAADQALGLVSTEILGSAGRSVGLDTLRVEQEVSTGQIRFDASLIASETDPSTRLTVGKNLSDQVQLIASQDLQESGRLTWIVEYLPRRNVELRLVLDDVNDKAYEFRHALSLGDRRRTPPVERRESRVAAVRLEGHGAAQDAAIRSRLRLREGDRFDFYQWQQDRDELERYYAVRGFLESRVRPQRAQSDDGSVILTYIVRRGPQSVLTFEGYRPPDEVIRQMRDAWNRAVFDGFLLEELQTLAREHLSISGFLQARIEADVLPAGGDDRKEIVLRIDEGPRTSERRIVFRGNQRLSTDDLQAFVVSRDLDETAWADSELLTQSLLALYQSAGMLEARVVADPLEIAGDTATLPVRVAEGTPFTISHISVEGVHARPAETVQGLVGPQEGDVFSGRAITETRTRIDRSYRSAGFNQARIAARSAVDPASDTVSVTLEIKEGPRQVVEEVEVVGGDNTNDALISRALEISPGQPVDLGAWNRARRRLYDTGAFRTVDIDAEPIGSQRVGAEAADQPVRARVRLEEWPAYRLRYGLQLKDEEVPFGDQSEQNVDLGVVGDLTRQNFLGRAVTLGTAFRWDTDQRVMRGFGRIPTFFGLPITSNLFVARQHRTFGDPDFRTVEDLTLLTLEQRLRPRPKLTVAYSYNFDWNHAFDPDPDPDALFGGFDETIKIARLAGGIIVDTRDDLFDATRGWFHSSNIEYAPDALGSEFRFAKFTGQQFHYWPVGRGIVLASAARIGLAAAFDQDLILSERFFAGGGNTVRGYRQDTLGPLFLGSPDGGNALIVLNQEVRFPIAGFVRGVGFLDAGNVFPLIEDFTLSGLRVGAGLGLRFDTPFGLFRLDFAAPLSEIEESRKSRFFFSIGQVF